MKQLNDAKPVSKSIESRIRLAFWIGLLGIVQYLVITTILMQMYPGGNLMDRHSEGFSFVHNFMSDLGRTTNFGRHQNPTAPFYALTLATAGLSIMIFFAALVHFFAHFRHSAVIYLCLLCGIGAGLGYIGIAFHPINTDYGMHVRYVQISFIAFWLMTVTCAIGIYQNPAFHNVIGHILLAFALVLGLQICVMILGPRSWSSPGALLLQVIAQKVVVYSEIATMTVLNIAALRALSRYQRRFSG